MGHFPHLQNPRLAIDEVHAAFTAIETAVRRLRPPYDAQPFRGRNAGRRWRDTGVWPHASDGAACCVGECPRVLASRSEIDLSAATHPIMRRCWWALVRARRAWSGAI